MATRSEVYEVIDSERDYQDQKWGADRPHEVGAFILFMEHHLQRAREACSSSFDVTVALDEIRKVTALGVVTMEQHGGRKR